MSPPVESGSAGYSRGLCPRRFRYIATKPVGRRHSTRVSAEVLLIRRLWVRVPRGPRRCNFDIVVQTRAEGVREYPSFCSAFQTARAEAWLSR
jgi:hypothetical protein